MISASHNSLRQPARLLRQAIDASKQHCLNAGRNVGRRVVGFDPPMRTIALQAPDLDQPAHDFLHKQRISAGAIEDAIAEIARRSAPMIAEQRRQQPLSVGVAERRKTQRRVAHPA